MAPVRADVVPFCTGIAPDVPFRVWFDRRVDCRFVFWNASLFVIMCVTPLVARNSNADPLTFGLFVTSAIEFGIMLLLSIWLNLENLALSCLMSLAFILATGWVVDSVPPVIAIDRACDAWLGVVA